MKLSKVAIRNFRNIEQFDIDLKNQTTILSGKNGLGKSNCLNAVNWLLTDTLFTDKYGTGENDIDTIVPAGDGLKPDVEVSLFLEDDSKFTKVFKTEYQKGSDKVKGHTTKFYINDALCNNKNEFYDTLFEKLNYNPKLKILSKTPVKELNLFIDPLYALQKLDANQLRALLIALGCGVTNEELYQENYEFQKLKEYETKYSGHFDAMRTDLKRKRRDLEKEIDSIQMSISMYGNPEEPKDGDLKALNSQLEQLAGRKQQIENNGNSAEITSQEQALELAFEKRKLEIAGKENEIDQQIKSIQKEIDNSLIEQQKEQDAIKESIRIYTKQKEMATQSLTEARKTFVSCKEKIPKLSVKLEEKRKEVFTDYAVCPNCGERFPTDFEKLHHFELEKDAEINEILSDIRATQDLLKETSGKGEQASSNLKLAEEELKKLQAKVKPLPEVDIEKQIQIANLLKEKESLAANTPMDEISKIQEKIAALKQNNDTSILVNDIEIQIAEVNAKISEYYIKKSKYDTAVEFKEKLAVTQIEYNDCEYLIGLVDDFIHTMISKINRKAYEVTGIEFVMLEENVSNDGVKEVCYATLSGVEFQSVNTAEKLKTGIKFIERMKKITGCNDLPILADRLESIDSLKTIAKLTNEQLICTRVGEEEKITILEV